MARKDLSSACLYCLLYKRVRETGTSLKEYMTYVVGWLVGWFGILESLNICVLAAYVTRSSHMENPGRHKRWSSAAAGGQSGHVFSFVLFSRSSTLSRRSNVAAKALERMVCRYLDLSLGSDLNLPSPWYVLHFLHRGCGVHRILQEGVWCLAPCFRLRTAALCVSRIS